MKPSSLGFAAVNGIKIYHEIYGEGEPLVLIHGGLTTIGQMQGWVRPLCLIRCLPIAANSTDQLRPRRTSSREQVRLRVPPPSLCSVTCSFSVTCSLG